MGHEIRWIYDRLQLYFLLEEHPDWTPEALATVVGRTARWVRKWRQRFAETGQKTVAMFLSQSRAPKTRSRQIPEVIRNLIGDLREELSEQYHRIAGARLIQWALQQRTDLEESGYVVPKSASTIHRILKEMGYVRQPKSREREPVVLPEPNEEWEMDFGEIRIDEETILEFFLVVDHGTSRVIYLAGSMGYTAETALEAVFRLLQQQGFPQRLRFDRDSRFVGSWTTDSYPSALVRFLRVVGVEPIICPPRRPDLKPFVERGIKTLKHEWLDRFSPDTWAEAVEILPGFVDWHNTQRVHFGRACQGQIPDEAFPELPALPKLPETVHPNAWLHADRGRVFRRRITSNGTIQIDKHRYYVDARRAKMEGLVDLDADARQFHILHEQEVLVSLDIQGLHTETLDLPTYLHLMKPEARSIEMHRLMTWYQVGEID